MDSVAAEQQQEHSEAGWTLYVPHALIFFSSACIMVVELVAGRLIARHLGSSLYTWTSIIGVVLAGMSVGNMFGGRMADRWRPRAILGWLFLAASVCCLLTLFLNGIAAASSPLKGVHWPTRVFFTVLVIFLLPAMVLGTISPVVAKMALERSERLGKTIGSVYAWGAIGSIVGTLSTGFWLIAALGAQGVVLAIATGLAVIGVVLGPRRWVHGVWVLLLLALVVVSKLPSARAASSLSVRLGLADEIDASYLFAEDSNYQFVKVYKKKDGDRDDPQKKRALRVLALDHLVHGYVDPTDAGYFHYRYERVYRDAALSFMRKRKKIAAFFLGGGSYTFPRWVLEKWPGSRVEVAEIDPMVVEANHLHLGLPRDTAIKTYTLDASNAIDDLAPGNKFDLIFGDAFNDLSIPFHLTTVEFTRKLAEHITPKGVYLANVIDDFESALFLCSFVETMKRVFPHVYVFTTSRWGVTAGRETWVVAGSRAKLDESRWLPGHPTENEGSILPPHELRALHSRCQGRFLTDDDSPVENLLLPVIRKRK